MSVLHLNDLVLVRPSMTHDAEWAAKVCGFPKIAGIQMVHVEALPDSHGVVGWSEVLPFRALTKVGRVVGHEHGIVT